MIIHKSKTIIPACDVSVERFERLVKETTTLDCVGGYKLGFVLGLSVGLPRAVEIARRHTTKPLIYDHQKAGTDIPDTGKSFARVCKDAGIDAVIFFPQAGPKTEQAWIEAASAEKLHVIVGGAMSHPAYLQSDGGYIADAAVEKIYQQAAELGVTDFVVPGTHVALIKKIRVLIEAKGVTPTFYSPGLGIQGGSIAETSKAAGDRFHAIVGRSIYDAADIARSTVSLARQL